MRKAAELRGLSRPREAAEPRGSAGPVARHLRCWGCQTLCLPGGAGGWLDENAGLSGLQLGIVLAALPAVGISLGGIGSNLAAGWLLQHVGPAAPYIAGGVGALLLGASIPLVLPPAHRLSEAPAAPTPDAPV